MDLSNLKPAKGSTQSKKRIGRGEGSGKGGTATKGHKGQKSRAGASIPAWFEGGQMPLQRRLPKRGFKNPFRREYEIVNVGDLARIESDEITLEALHAHRLIDLGKGRPVKVLGNGEIGRKLSIQAHAVSDGARAKIEAAGGSIEILEV